MFRLLPSILAAVFAALLLSACYPEYDWREVSVADGRAVALFPARVRTEQRQVEWDGHSVAFTMSAATVDQAVFAVGHVVLPDPVRNDPAAARRWVETRVRGLYANFQAEPPAALPGAGDDILIETVRAGEPVRLMGRVQLIGGALVEAMAAGPADALPRERALEFVSSLKRAG